jgi:hypothetical protein
MYEMAALKPAFKAFVGSGNTFIAAYALSERADRSNY